MDRAITLNVTAPAVPRAELVQLLVYHVTGGDPAAYLDRLAEKMEHERTVATAHEK